MSPRSETRQNYDSLFDSNDSIIGGGLSLFPFVCICVCACERVCVSAWARGCVGAWVGVLVVFTRVSVFYFFTGALPVAEYDPALDLALLSQLEDQRFNFLRKTNILWLTFAFFSDLAIKTWARRAWVLCILQIVRCFCC